MNIDKLIKDDLDSKYQTMTSSTDIKRNVDFIKVKKKENVLIWKLTSFSLASMVIIFIVFSSIFFFNARKKTTQTPTIYPSMNISINNEATLNISFQEDNGQLIYYYKVEGEVTPFTIEVESNFINVTDLNKEGILTKTSNKSNLIISIITSNYEEQLMIDTSVKQ